MENIINESTDSAINNNNGLIRYAQTASTYMAVRGYSLNIISASPAPISARTCSFPFIPNEPTISAIITAKVNTRLIIRLALNREETQLMKEPIIVAAIIGSNGINKSVIRKNR
ncbi:hypothetical protein D3C81_1985730 [compost metagenome]